jgi:hypothetical protein
MGKARGDSAAGLAEERLNSLLKLSSECYWETDDSHRFTVIAGAALQTASFDAQRDLGKVCWESGAIPVADAGSWEPHKALWQAMWPPSRICLDPAGVNVHFLPHPSSSDRRL